MSGEKVLLVDDEKEFVEALSERMTSRGLDVEVAGSGYEAIQKAKQKEFDAVILDLSMPGMDGIETLTNLRDDHPDLQVILLTGYATVEKGVEAVKLGAMDFLGKPANIDLLMDKVREAKARTDAAHDQHVQEMIDDVIKTKGW
jgi:DNA-binding NtrC family response regulator